MNKRIKELLKQAGGHPNYKAFRGHFLPPPPDYIDPITVNLEKFTELIVRECANIAETRMFVNVSFNEPDKLSYNGGILDACDEFKSHFGVE